jgi:hypothetical protein
MELVRSRTDAVAGDDTEPDVRLAARLDRERRGRRVADRIRDGMSRIEGGAA